MRIIVNAISANTGGIVTYTNNLIEYIASEDVETIVYVPGWFEASELSKGKATAIPLKKRFYGPVHRFLWEQFAWRRIIKEQKADVVFSSANYGVLFSPVPQVLLVQGEIYLNPVYREKVLPNLSWRERLSAYLRRNLMLVSARCSKSVIFPSKVAMQSAIAYDAKLEDIATVNYLGVSPRFRQSAKKRQWREDGIIRLLYVSVYYPHKDPITLAEATHKLNEEGVPVATRITMEAHDFDAWDTAGCELSTLQDSKYTECLEMGRIDHETLTNALSDFDAFVFPSMAETFGFPMVEAMQAGIPLIVSDIPVHREICNDAAVYFRLGDSDDLAEKIKHLNGDPILRKKLVELGKIRAGNEFTWNNHVAGLVASLRNVVERKRFRLLINALHARSGGGVTYLRNMLPIMSKNKNLDVHVCLHEDQTDVLPTALNGIRFHFQRYERGFWRILFREQFEIPSLARRLGVDATFSPANYGPFFSRNHIIMVRNAVSVGFVERRPIKLAYWALLYMATLTSLLTCRRAIAVSNYAKRGIEGAFWKMSERMVVVPHGVDSEYIGEDDEDARQDFLLSVSDIYVQKNFVGLVKAMSLLREDFPDIRLKIAGNPVDVGYFEELRQLISSEVLDDHIEFLGHVETADLRELYRQCQVFVFPSTVETFGNPLVEAMACGAAIASSNTAAMPEVLGDAALFFDPTDVDDMANVISSLMSNYATRDELRKRAVIRAKNYSWEKTSQKTIDVIIGARPERR